MTHILLMINPYVQVERTPPDEKRRREKAAEVAAKENVEILLLTPFASSPKIEFERIKLGKSGVRKLLIRNPGDKPLDVLLDRLPKEDKGFNVDYVAFTLGGKEETSLLVGWTPTKAGGVRESIIVKFGGKFSAHVVLIGSCVDPDAKKRANASMSTTKPLGPRNTNVRPGSRTRPSVPASKLNASSVPKVSIPPNPVVRQDGSPAKRLIGGVSPPKPVSTVQPLSSAPKFVCGTTFNPRDFAKEDQFAVGSPRRETYVQERPRPANGDVVASTPLAKRETEGSRPEMDPRLSNIMPPPAQDIRRQTFVPSKLGLPPVVDTSSNDEEDTDYRRQTFVKLPKPPPVVPDQRTTYVKLPQPAAELPPTPDQKIAKVSESGESEAPVNLSMTPLNLSSKPKALADLLDQLNDVECEPLNLSLPNSGNKETKVSPAKEKRNITLNITETAPTPPRRYCPRVSDISLPDAEVSGPKTPKVKTPLRVADPKEMKTPLRDPRLAQLMGAMNLSGFGDLDLSLGSQFGDCSLAVNLASPARDRDVDFEEEELDEFEENKENIDEQELEMIAIARGTSALGNRSSSSTAEQPQSPRLSTGTIIKTVPTVELGMLPTVDQEQGEERQTVIERKSGQVVYEEEIITNEIVEEVIELEFEIVDGKKKLIGEKTLGTTVTKEMETICRTPTFKRRQAQCDISRMIEQHLSNSVPDQVNCVNYEFYYLSLYYWITFNLD